MYGFKPRHAQGKPVQNLADGGIVHSLTGMLGMRKRTPEELRAADAKNQARNQEAATAAAGRAQAAPEPAAKAAPAKAISDYSGMLAMQRREKEQGLADGGAVKPRGFKAGGMIRGPGTGTSDSIETEKRPGTFIMPADSTQAIGPEALEELGEVESDSTEEQGEKMPVRLSNGEFELPPEQVQALGEAVLTVMRNATHQPAGGQEAPTGKGFTPHQFFSGGGTVKPRGFVAGKGTGTSDSIPARLSNGEYVLPADTVKAVGVEALDSLRAATHTPVKHEQAKAAHGFFAGGTPGGVDEDWQRQMEMERSARTQKANSIASEAMAQSQAESDKLAAQSSRPAAPIGGLANQTAMYVRGAQEAAANRPPEPAAPAQPASTSAGLNAPWWSREYATAARLSDKSGLELEQQRAAAATPSQAPANDPVKRIVNTGTLSMPQAVTKPADVAPTAPAAPNPTDQRLAAGTQQAPTVPSAAETPAPAPSPAPSQDVQAGPPMSASSSVVRNGNSYSGSNIAGDVTFRNPDGSVRRSGGSVSTLPAGASPMGPAAGFVPGGISTQNMGAADALAAREYAASMGRLMASGQIAAPAAGPSMSLSGGTFGFRRDRNIVADERGAQARFAYGQGTDPASRARNAQLQQTAMQEAGALARAGIQEQGANARDAGRTALARDEFGLRKDAAGFQTRAATRLEGLQTRYEAETDPAKRADLAKQLREIQGKEQPARYKVAAGGQQIDANGVAYKVPDRVFNEQTGQFSDGTGAAPAPAAAPRAGETRNGYRFKGGNPNDQANWAKV